MRFIHLADVHIGAWRDPAMKELPILAFEHSVAFTIEKKVDFLLIAGDLFNTSIPPLDQVKRVVTELQRLKSAEIPVYIVAGSHDYSPSGKTMLDVLEEAGLLVNVMKGEVVEDEKGRSILKLRFTTDKMTRVKLTGILGRAGALDRSYYEDLDREALEQEPGEKIFLFHAAITELKTEELAQMDSNPITILPKGFDYYAGGHVHIVNQVSIPDYKQVIYPGPLFPASFSELESLGNGSLCLVEDWKVERVPIVIKERIVFKIDCDKKSAVSVNQELTALEESDVNGKIVLVRLSGELSEGRVSDLGLRELIKRFLENGAYFVMQNTSKLATKEFEEYAVTKGTNEELEEKLIKEHAGQLPINDLDVEGETTLTKELLKILGEESSEGEKKYEYEERVMNAAKERLER